MKHKTRTKALSWLLSLAMVLSLLPGMSLTALAWDGDPYASLVNTTTTVTFNGKPWYIIADNSTAADAGTVTLLAADTSFGLSKFHGSSKNNYSNSTVKGVLDALTAEGGAFAAVKDAIADTNLTDVGVSGAKLYLLSKSEANALSSAVRKMNFSNDFSCWWLRSPGYSDFYATYVNGQNGNVDVNSSTYSVSKSLGVRPALKLNLSSVIFSSESNSFTLKPAHTHSFTYSADGATITAVCTADDCPLPDDGNGNHTATLTIKPPANLVYSGSAKEATVEGTIPDVETPSIKYIGRGDTTYESTDAPTEMGNYTASITLSADITGGDPVTASVDFTIKDASYTITIPATLKVADAGWNDAGGITAKGEIAEDKKLTVTASSDGEFALVNQDDNMQKVSYYLATEEGGAATTVWDFSVDELAEQDGTTKTMGAVVEEFLNKPAGEYTDTVTFTAEIESKGPKTYTSLTNGDVLHVGDIVAPTNTGYNFSGGVSFNSGKTYTLLRADIVKGTIPTVTEKNDGAYYVFKRQSGTYLATPNGSFKGFEATDTSDGLVITKSGNDWNIAVHEP